MKHRKRILAALLAVVMTISMLPVSAFAAETAGDTAAENDAEPVIVSNEEYVAEPTVEDASNQDAQEEAEVEAPSEETAENKAAEPEAQSETEPEVQPEVIPASKPEEEQPVQPETEPASAEESAEIKEEAADAEPVTLTYEGRDYTVTAAFDPTAFPAGVQMKAREIRKSNSSYQDLYDQALETVQKETEEEVEITHARFFDITFYTDKEDNIEPDGTVNVNIKYTNALTVESTDDISVLHFDEKKEEPQLMEIETSGSRDDKVDEISFETESFSVYAIIGTTPTEDDGTAIRFLTVEFYGIDLDNPAATMLISNEEQTDASLNKIIYDPESKLDLPDGWVFTDKWLIDTDEYTLETEGSTIGEVRTHIKERNFSDGDVLKVYAMVFRYYTVEYFTEDGQTRLESEKIPYDEEEEEEESTEIDYTVDFDYPFYNEDFAGWRPSDTSSSSISNISYPENVTANTVFGGISNTAIKNIKIKGNVSLVAYAPKGHWLTFDTGERATFIPSKYIHKGEVTVRPASDPERFGYQFDGWFTENGDPFTFGTEIEEDTTVKAGWTAGETGNYRVIIWKQKLLEQSDGTYTVGDEYEVHDVLFYENRPTVIKDENDNIIGQNTINRETAIEAMTFQAGGRENHIEIKLPDDNNAPSSTKSKIKITGFRYDHFDQNVEIKPDGTSILNVYFKRNIYDFIFHYPKDRKDLVLTDFSFSAYYDEPVADRLAGFVTRATSSFKSTEDARPYFSEDDVLWYLEKMPDRDFYFYQTTDLGFRRIFYYIETLPGQNYTDTYNGTNYRMFGELASKQEYWTVAMLKAPSGCVYKDNRVTLNLGIGHGNKLPCRVWQYLNTGIIGEFGAAIHAYYTREAYTVTYKDGVYVDENEIVTPSKHHNTLKAYTSDNDKVKWGASLNNSKYNYKPDPTDIPSEERSGREGYVFGGWYTDEDCTQYFDFEKDVMPIGHLTLYAKWHIEEYRIFLRPNAGSAGDDNNRLEWGVENYKGMNFKIHKGEIISAPTGIRTGHKFDGWYLDPDYSVPLTIGYTPTDGEDGDLEPYNTRLEENYTDPMDVYGKGATYNKDDREHRDWITQKLEVYGKWIPYIVGADGIKMVYVVGTEENEQEIETNLLYKDGVDAVALAADEAVEKTPENSVFAGWEQLTYNIETDKFDRTGIIVFPGDTFTVSKEYAKITDPNDNDRVLSYEEALAAVDANPNKLLNYVVKLRANYVDDPTATSVIPWYEGYGDKEAFHVDTWEENETKSRLTLHKEVEIQKAPERTGYTFLGWARVDMTGVNNDASAKVWMNDPGNYNRSLTETNLFLHYNIEDGKFYSAYSDETGKFSGEVTKIAADSRTYQAMFAVWKAGNPTFKIYHSSDGKTEVCNVPMTRKNEQVPFNITERVREGCLYGGYFGSNDDHEKLSAGWEPGTAITEIADADTVFYLKEVNSNYLKPQLYMVYSNIDSDRSIRKWYGLVNIDSAGKETEGGIVVSDGDYYTCGLSVTDEDGKEVFDNDTDTVAEEIVVTKYGAEYGRLNRETFGGEFNKETGALKDEKCYLGCLEIPTDIIKKGATLQIAAWYVTGDGIKVTGSKLRMIQFADEDPVTFTGWTTKGGNTRTGIREGKSTVEVRPLTFGFFLHSKKRMLVETQDKVEYTVTKIYGPAETGSQTVDPGDNTGSINYKSRDEYMFAGWYMDEELTVPASFSNVRGDMTVYARYVPRKDVTLTLARKSGKTGTVTFTATVSVKNTDQFAETGVLCDHNGVETGAALTRKTGINIGSNSNPKYTYRFSGPVEVENLESIDSFKASVYWVTKDGTKVTEAARNCTYKSGSVKVQT